MQRVNRPSAVAAMPAPPAPGTPGYFTGGNPGSGIPATVPGYEWFNGVQEEIINLIQAGGVFPSSASNNQMVQSLGALFPGLFAGAGRMLSSPGYYILPGQVTLCWGTFSGTTAATLTNGVAEVANIGITFPISFATAPWLTWVTPRDVVGTALQETAWVFGAPTATGMQAGLSCKLASAAMTGHYLAIGY